MIPGVYTIKCCARLNSKRVSMSKYQNTEKVKLRCKRLCGQHNENKDHNEDNEGKLYCKGEF